MPKLRLRALVPSNATFAIMFITAYYRTKNNATPVPRRPITWEC